MQTSLKTDIDALISAHSDVRRNLSRQDLIAHSVERKEAIITTSGALATWNPAGCTGRIPKDTYMVEHSESRDSIDWSAPACIAMQPQTFDALLQDALNVLKRKDALYVLDRCVGADSSYALPVSLVTDRALSTLFCDNMYRDLPEDIAESQFADKGFTLVAVPHDAIDTSTYEGVLRSENGKTVDMVMAMDFDRRIGLVYGTSYCGCLKKMLFTILNYDLPEVGILPLHCSANESAEGDVTLFLGLSGTGKTTVSNVPDRALIGDDEHGWSGRGVANFEGGCYAKLIDLDPSKEPQIYEAVFRERPFLEHGAIMENAMVYPDGSYDLSDGRLTENSRASYPTSFLPNVKKGQTGGHPQTIIFLTADAAGVLPPVAKLDTAQAMLWFLMGYTSKLAGTEAGVTEPKAAFSRFFGAPFMPRHPQDYADLLGSMMEEHAVDVYLVNTGWSGGPYGVGSRMDIMVTRAVVDAALNGSLKDVDYRQDDLFHFSVPTNCPGIDAGLLDPQSTWEDPTAYNEAATKLASQFAESFQKQYGSADLDDSVKSACPGV